MKTKNQHKNGNESFMICLDDDRDFLNSLKISLPTKFRDKPNCTILFMDSPFETLEMIRELVEDKEDIALLVTDQMMPNMKGIDFLKEAMKLTPRSMRVLLTGHAGMDSAIVAINENVLDKYLTKPVNDIEDFVLTLKRLLNEFQLKSTVDIQQQIILDLYQFSNSLNTLQTLDDTLEETLSFIRKTLKSERISILLVEDGALSIKASIGIPDNIVQQIRISVGNNIVGRVLKDRQPILVKNIDQIPWIKNKINDQCKSFISTPMLCAELSSFDVPLGVINVTNKDRNGVFSEHDLKTLSFIANTASVAIHNQQNREKLEQSYFDTISALIMTLEARDNYTKGHSVRVMRYSEAISKQMGLDASLLKIIRDAAMLHDIGKIGIRDEVLLKGGLLTPEEVEEIRKHPEISGTIVKAISSLQEVGLVVSQHHERYDGSGYPQKLKGETIHIGARIMAVADAYDAMTSHRPYRDSLDHEKVLSELRNGSGTQFDPECVKALMRYLEISRDKEKSEWARI
jgi:putative nucleotidyltransferase with HDIG domain